MKNFCPKCGALVAEDSGYCPKCGTPVQYYTQKKPKHKLFRSLPFLINTGVFLLISIVMAVINSTLIDKRYYYERYTKEYIDYHILRGTTGGIGSAALWITIIVAVIGVVFLIIPTHKSDKEKARINIITLILPLVIFIACGIYSYMDSLPQDVYEKMSFSRITNFTGLDGKRVPSSDISDDVYNYYATVVDAYNQLNKDGDTDAFFEAVSEEKFPKLMEKLEDLKELYYLPEESLQYGKPLMKDALDALSKVTGIKGTVNAVMDRANVFFDLFYDRELFVKNPYYTYDHYIGEYIDGAGNKLEIKGIAFDIGKIHFVYENLPEYNLELENGKAYFKYQYTQLGQKGYGMIHIVGDDIFINVYDPLGNIDSAHYTFDDKFED